MVPTRGHDHPEGSNSTAYILFSTTVAVKSYYKYVLPLLLSSEPGPSPPFPTLAGLRLRCPHLPAAQPSPTVSQSLHSTHEHAQPFHSRDN